MNTRELAKFIYEESHETDYPMGSSTIETYLREYKARVCREQRSACQIQWEDGLPILEAPEPEE